MSKNKVVELRGIAGRNGKNAMPNSNADIVRGKSIRIHGMYGNTPYDRTFQIGDTVEVGSYNLVYFGTIVQITEKSVTIKPTYERTNKRMSLMEFTWRNYDFNEATARKRNSEWMD